LVESVGFVQTGIITMVFVLVQFPILYYMFKGVDYAHTADIVDAYISDENAGKIDAASGHHHQKVNSAADESTADAPDAADDEKLEMSPLPASDVPVHAV